MIQQLTGTDEVAGRCCLIGLQVLIKRLTGANQLADRYYSSGRLALIKLLTVACQAAVRHLSPGCIGAFQLPEWALVKWLTGTDEVVDQSLNDQQRRK